MAVFDEENTNGYFEFFSPSRLIACSDNGTFEGFTPLLDGIEGVLHRLRIITENESASSI